MAKAFRHLGYQVKITSDAGQISVARQLVLPGVGNFRATAALEESGAGAAISAAIRSGAMFLGICLGMQWLYEGSSEAPGLPGLAVFEGICDGFGPGVKTTHVGWNSIEVIGDSRLLRNIRPEEFVYFTHSYRALPGAGTVAISDYAGAFAAAVERDNIFGVQFHPEKSATAGLQVLRNFAELPC